PGRGPNEGKPMTRIWSMAVLVALGSGQAASPPAPPAPGALPSEEPTPVRSLPSPPMVMPPAAAATPARGDAPHGPGGGGWARGAARAAREPAGSPAGRQESLMSVTWAGPSLVQVGQRAEYGLLVKNTSPLRLHKVQASVRLPAGMTARETRPAAAPEA